MPRGKPQVLSAGGRCPHAEPERGVRDKYTRMATVKRSAGTGTAPVAKLATANRQRAGRCGRASLRSRQRASGAERLDPQSSAHGQGAAGGIGSLVARARHPQRRQRAHALPGRARGDQPHSDRRRRIASGLELRLSQLLRLDEEGSVTVVRAGTPARGNRRRGHSFEVLTSAQPGQRAELSRTRSLPGRYGAPTTRPCTSRQPRDGSRRARVRRARVRRRALRAQRWRLRDLRRRPAHHFENPTRARPRSSPSSPRD